MVWMDKYKQFQEWEAKQNTEGKFESGGTVNSAVDKAVQSPSESTIYTRICKSVESNISSQELGSLDVSGELVNGQMLVDKAECSSTASTLDDYANIDINQIFF